MPKSSRNHHRRCPRGLWLLVAAVFCLVHPGNAQAIPLADYHKNLQRAIAALDSLAQRDEEESESDFDKRLGKTVGAIRSAVPENQMVQSGEELCSVDNSWLHSQLSELEKCPPPERPLLLMRLLERLRAIEERVAAMQKPTGIANNKTASQEKLATILAGPDYAPRGKNASALTRLLRNFLRWLESLFPKRTPLAPDRASSITRIAQFVVIIVALAVIAYVLRLLLSRLARARKQKKREKPQPRIVLGERLEPEESAKDLLSEAEALARGGQLRAAIRKAYIALLVELGDRKVISLAQHKTNRDYLRSVRNVPTLYSNMSGLTDSFERHWYGFVQATPTDWQEFRAGYQTTLQNRS